MQHDAELHLGATLESGRHAGRHEGGRHRLARFQETRQAVRVETVDRQIDRRGYSPCRTGLRANLRPAAQSTTDCDTACQSRLRGPKRGATQQASERSLSRLDG
jgi:hypothetical protein